MGVIKAYETHQLISHGETKLVMKRTELQCPDYSHNVRNAIYFMSEKCTSFNAGDKLLKNFHCRH